MRVGWEEFEQLLDPDECSRRVAVVRRQRAKCPQRQPMVGRCLYQLLGSAHRAGAIVCHQRPLHLIHLVVQLLIGHRYRRKVGGAIPWHQSHSAWTGRTELFESRIRDKLPETSFIRIANQQRSPQTVVADDRLQMAAGGERGCEREGNLRVDQRGDGIPVDRELGAEKPLISAQLRSLCAGVPS